jgi:hypothetical protein
MPQQTTWVTLSVESYRFRARLDHTVAPASCAAFLALLPLRRQIIHARWSGEALWVPFGEERVALPWEDATSYPAVGQLLLYPGGVSEMEILVPYGPTRFASKAGQLAGNHFLTIVQGLDQLRRLGEMTLWQGAQPILFERA